MHDQSAVSLTVVLFCHFESTEGGMEGEAKKEALCGQEKGRNPIGLTGKRRVRESA